MSATGRPERELLPLGGTGAQRQGGSQSATGRPERELLPLGGTGAQRQGGSH
jgi:hypothetical protein